MSTEDDLVKIAAVTDKLVGPTKVWVLEMCGDHDGTSLHWTRQGALKAAARDMETVASLTPKAIEGHIREMGYHGATCVKDGMRMCNYHIDQYEVGE